MSALHTIHGIVQEGHKRGKSLGFPTINFPVSQTIDEGIYISTTLVGMELYKSLTFIGTAKTYDETTFQAETYLFGFAKDIYGTDVEVSLLHKIRENEKFASEEQLIHQMERDKQKAEEYFLEHIEDTVL